MTKYPYDREIELAIIKTAGKVQRADLDDLRQEVKLALLSANVVLNERLAYSIARKTVIDVLRKSRPMEDINDPAILQQAEKVHNYTPDEETGLDAAMAASNLNKLPHPYGIILKLLFGIDGDAYSEDEVAEMMNMSQDSVSRK